VGDRVSVMNENEFEKTTVTDEYDEPNDFDQLDQRLAAKFQVRRSRKGKLYLLAILLLLLAGSIGLVYRYFDKPAPLPELVLPNTDIHYPPHYLFSIYEVEKPIGVTVSPDGDRIYASENGGQRLIKIFDREGELINSFSPPGTRPGERAPVYMAVDSHGRVYVTDRMQHAIYVYDFDGNFVDMIISPDLPLSEYIRLHTGKSPASSRFTYNVFQSNVTYRDPFSGDLTLPTPIYQGWSPLGIRIDSQDRIYVTDVTKGMNKVMEFNVPPYTSESKTLKDWNAANPEVMHFGSSGAAKGEFLFPNTAAVDSQGRRFVSDGNNGRISVWSANGDFLFNFGGGGGENSLSLPRGIFIDEQDRLFIVDAVGQNVKVFDVSHSEPVFLYNFGGWGLDNALFNYPNDLYVDDTGRIYIVDRENDRLQVWSY
jgi:DNA-binding beta-propeller fold protein YncE